MHCLKSRFSGIVKNSIYLLAVMGWSAQGSNAELHWSTVSPSPSAEHLMGIAHGNGLYVAVGFNGTILTSSDGSAWTASPNTSGVTLYGVCAKDGLFVAVGEAGTIVTSQDGSTWTTRTSPVTDDLKSVTWSGARFVAVGLSNTVITSETGEDWTQQTFEYSTDLNSVAWGNNMFVAVGFDGMAGTVTTSTDGIVWSSTINCGSEGLFSVAWCKTQFIAGSYPMFSSSDGATWGEISTEMMTGEDYIVGIAADNDQIVAVGGNGTIVVTPDGSTWTNTTSGVSEYLNSVASNGVTFVAVGMNGTIVHSSPSNSAGRRLESSLNKQSFKVKNMTAYYTLTSDEYVAIALYSLQGKHLKSLVNEHRCRGVHHVNFAEGLPSGKYILSYKTPALFSRQIVAVSKE